jgi:hypothetical protein
MWLFKTSDADGATLLTSGLLYCIASIKLPRQISKLHVINRCYRRYAWSGTGWRQYVGKHQDLTQGF